MGGIPIQNKLAQYFAARPNQLLFIEDLVRDLGESRQRVLQGMQRAVHNSLLSGLEKKGSGGPWLYVPNNSSKASNPDKPQPEGESRELFEYLANLSDGSLLLKGTDGKVYRATEL